MREGSQVRVQITQTSACAACHAKGMCTAAESREKVIDATTTDLTLQTGDAVRVLVQEHMGWKAVLLAYFLPFVLLIIAVVIGGLYTKNEAWIGLIGIGTVMLYYAGLYAFRKRVTKQFAFTAIKE